MSEYALWTEQDVADFDCACRLLMSASCCIGLRDELAQELVHDVLKLLYRISGKSAPAQLAGEAPMGGVH